MYFQYTVLGGDEAGTPGVAAEVDSSRKPKLPALSAYFPKVCPSSWSKRTSVLSHSREHETRFEPKDLLYLEWSSLHLHAAPRGAGFTSHESRCHCTLHGTATGLASLPSHVCAVHAVLRYLDYFTDRTELLREAKRKR